MTPHKDWPHAPVHRLDEDGIYMITGATLHRKLLFLTSEKLTLLENEILTLAKAYYWQLEAWAVLGITTTWLRVVTTKQNASMLT